jgi:23S rRNA pseudouridine1911/1915/1917 synthase
MTQSIRLRLTVPDEMRGRRLDQVLAELVREYSRSRLQQWIRAGQVSLDDRIPQVRERIHGGEIVCINATIEAQTRSGPEPIPLQVLYADSDLLVIDKPAGLVVHPAAGNPAGTLLNALLHYDPALADLPRAGIVHRLDKATSGVLVVARNLTAHKSLVDALQARRVKREYLAVVQTVLTAGGSVDAPIGRHPVDRKRMAVVPGGKESLTHYRVEERFRAHTLVRVQLETGRTHQIRVHMAHQHIPILGDPVYGGRLRLPPGAGSELQAQLTGFRRQALHAARLTLTHPSSGETVSWSAPLPADMTRLLETLRTDARQHAPA